jgi:hypothetical protein
MDRSWKLTEYDGQVNAHYKNMLLCLCCDVLYLRTCPPSTNLVDMMGTRKGNRKNMLLCVCMCVCMCNMCACVCVCDAMHLTPHKSGDNNDLKHACVRVYVFFAGNTYV